MDVVEGAGVPLAVAEQGAGEPAVLVHGMAARADTLGAEAAALAQAGLRVVAYDRRGYGASGAPQPYTATTVDEQGQDLIAVLRARHAAPALLVGDGFGALVVLDVLCREPALVRAAALRDPPLLAFAAQGAELLSDQRLLLEDALRSGGPRAGVAAWLGEDAGPARLAAAQDDHAGFFADYAGLASWPVTRAMLRAVTVPVAVTTGAATPAPVEQAADALAGLVPGALRTHDGDLAVAARLVA